MRATTSRTAPDRRPQERRRHTRFRFITEVHFGSPSNFYTGFTRNISEGGIFVATYSPFPVGTVMELEIKMPDNSPPIAMRGEVRWRAEPSEDSDGEPGLGVKFIDLDDADRLRIERFTRYRETMFFED